MEVKKHRSKTLGLKLKTISGILILANLISAGCIVYTSVESIESKKVIESKDLMEIKTSNDKIYNTERSLSVAREKNVDYTNNTAKAEIISTENREEIIESKTDAFVLDKSLKPDDIVSVEPLYDNGKLVVSSRQEAICLDIRTKSNWTSDDFYNILNKEMHALVPVAIRLEKEVGVNALYIIAIGATETGWGKHMAAKNNYFNWSNDGILHFGFETIDDFANFSINNYKNYYTNESFYTDKLGFEVSSITPEVVNVKYAINPNGSVNWQWSNVVCEIMSGLSGKRVNLTE